MSRQKKTEEMTSPKQTALPHALILNNSQNSKSAEEACEWDHSAPSAHNPIQTQKQKIQKKTQPVTDKEIGRKTSQKETTTHKPKVLPIQYFSDRLSHHYKMEKDRNERLEFLNDKYNLDYYSDSNSESDSKQKYETLV